jgi:hypothetical protein
MTHLDLRSPSTKKLIAIILSSFLITFAISRLFVYLVLGHLMPDFFLTIKGVHIHHFTYGVFILALVGLYFILKRPEVESRAFKWTTLFYGIGLGLTFDEFGMWIRLEDNYWIRQSYDAVIIVTLLLLNIAYHRTVWSWFKEMWAMLKRFWKL